MTGYMYILLCADGSYYVGSTKYLDYRIIQHQQGTGGKYTCKRLPVELVYFEVYNRIDVAFQREHQIKRWSRKKKESLIRGDFDALPDLAKKVFRKDGL